MTEEQYQERLAKQNPAGKAFRLTRPVEPESSVLSGVLKVLQLHRRVAFAARMNSGAGRFMYPDGSTSQFLRFGFKGMSDILGLLVDGRFLAVECKRAGEKLTDEQQAFFELVRNNNAVAIVAYGIDDVIRELGPV